MKLAHKQAYSNQVDTMHPSLKIGEVSQLSGIGIEALRFYERSGLLGKPARSRSGYRLYDKSVIDRLEFIKKAQALGFSLDEIRHIISESESGQSPCEEVREIVHRRLQELDERLRQMRRYRRELIATIAEWDEQGTAEGDICGLIENSEIETEQTVAAPVLQPKSSRSKK